MKNHLTKISSKYQAYIYSIPFLFSVLMLNVHFLLGSSYKPNILYTSLNVLAAMVMFFVAAYYVLKLWINESEVRIRLITVFAVLILICFCYILAFLRFGLYSVILKQAKSFVLYAPTAMLIGAVMGLKKGELDFFDKAELLSIGTVPTAINYVVMLLTNTSPYTNGGIGIADYMHLSYAYMPMLFILVIQCARGKDLFLLFRGRVKANIVRAFLIILNWMVILGCATRGTILCVMVFFIALVIYLLYLKMFRTKSFKTVILLFVIILCQFTLFTYVFTPKGLNRLDRVADFTDSLKDGEIYTSIDSPSLKEVGLDYLVENLPPTYAVDFEASGKTNTSQENVWIIGYTIKDRVTIFKLAWKQALNKPLTGLGPMGFMAKYGNYPHNFVLELLADLGFIMGGIVILFIILCFLKLAINSKKDPIMGFILVFLCGYVAYLMVSGTVWNHIVLMFGIGYSLCYRFTFRAELVQDNSDIIFENVLNDIKQLSLP